MKLFNIIFLLLLPILLLPIPSIECVKNGKNKKKIRKPVNKNRSSMYNPKKVNWKSLIKECQESFKNEKRLANFYIRAAAHDALTIVDGFGGADGSLLLTVDEKKRPENNYDTFSYIVSKSALKFAKKFNASVADIIAVCGAVATQFLGGPNIFTTGKNHFFVGRIDSYIPNPGNTLAPKNIDTFNFSKFAKDRNFTISEMTALMGSHVLLDEQGCRQSRNGNLQLFTWDNTYYRDVCNASYKIHIHNTKVRSNLTLPTFKKLKETELCKFTSEIYRKKTIDELLSEYNYLSENDIIQGDDFEYEDISYFLSKKGEFKKWIYTIHDAWMGKACIGELPKENYNINIKKWMNIFRKNPNQWSIVYSSAYKKMINLGVTWTKKGKMILKI